MYNTAGGNNFVVTVARRIIRIYYNRILYHPNVKSILLLLLFRHERVQHNIVIVVLI